MVRRFTSGEKLFVAMLYKLFIERGEFSTANAMRDLLIAQDDPWPVIECPSCKGQGSNEAHPLGWFDCYRCGTSGKVLDLSPLSEVARA